MVPRWVVFLVLVTLSAVADGKPGKGFWKVLVTPKAKWVLHDKVLDKADTITVETYDVRRVGTADVARLRWMHGKEPMGSTVLTPTQVAVTSAGIYLMDAELDDAKVAEQLKKSPSRSDPPKEYQGTKVNNGRYLRVDGNSVCMGDAPVPDKTSEPCADTCFAEVCVSDRGIESISGNAAPGNTMFER